MVYDLLGLRLYVVSSTSGPHDRENHHIICSTNLYLLSIPLYTDNELLTRRCLAQHAVNQDKALENLYHYKASKKDLKKRIGKIEGELAKKFPGKSYLNASFKAHPLYKERIACKRELEDVTAEKLVKLKRHWAPFQKKWGEIEGREDVCE